MESGKVLFFVTGNAKKFEEACAILQPELPDVIIKQVKIDLPELQGDPEEIVSAKLKIAAEKAEGPLIVDDTSLCYNALKGLPGPYIKCFLTKLGTKGLYEMVKNYEDQTAYAQCIYGLIRNLTGEPKLFVGKTDGKIVEARGSTKFGWDPVFQPQGFDQTYAEMSAETKNSISHRYKALKQMADWIKNNPDFFN